MADKKRWAFIPIDYSQKEKSVNGEIVVDKTNGNLWVKDDKGELQSATANLKEQIEEILSNGFMDSASAALTNNRKVYRFYYEGNIVRLDRNLNLNKSVAYYRIRDLATPKYYVNELTNIKYDGTSLYPFTNNEMYLVELFNVRRELVSQLVFTGKYGPTVLIGGEPDKIINRIEVHTNKDFMYVGEILDSLLVRVYAIYEDGSSKDITDYSDLVLDNGVDTSAEGTYIVKATYFYDKSHGQYVEAEKEVVVRVDAFAAITDMIVVPRKIINLNDGTKEIRLMVVAYFDDGSARDVSDEAIVSSNFNRFLFNERQAITVKFNAGHLNVITKDYNIIVKDSGAASDNQFFYYDNILRLDPDADYVPAAEAVYYRVRAANELSFYYTIGFTEMGYDSAFVELPNVEDRIQTGSNVIVEFFAADKTLIDSEVYSAQYKAPITP